jgi:uncharacterized protein
MRGTVLWDSSAILAFLDRDDANHAAALRTASLLAHTTPVITNYLEAEAHALLLRRLGRGPARSWLLEGQLAVVRARPAEEARAKEIVAQFSDKDWSLCDAVSFAVMELRRFAAAFSFDKHFRQFGRFRVIGLSHV